MYVEMDGCMSSWLDHEVVTYWIVGDVDFRWMVRSVA